MNLRAVLWLLGRVILVLAVFELVPGFVALFNGEREDALGFALSALASAAAGLLLCFRNRRATMTAEGRPDFFRREGLAAVGLAWIAIPIFGALPYLITAEIPSPVDALFESTSGFTTTGSSILQPSQIDALPAGVAFYRNFTNWLGGIGIVLVFVLLFPTGGRSLFRSEVPGISREAGARRVRDSAFGLVKIYCGLTGILVACLLLAGLTAYEAAVHAFATIATGGFSNHGASVAHFGSWPVEAILALFMFLSGINFALYDPFINGRWSVGLRQIWRSTETRVYTAITLSLVVLITFVLWFWGGSNGLPERPAYSEAGAPIPDYSSLALAFRDALFSVVTVQTTTGFATADFNVWPEFCRLALMLAGLVGGCAGSTSGGLKVIRLAIVVRSAVLVVQRFARPRAVQGVRLDGFLVEDGLVAATTAFFGLFCLVLAASSLALAAMGLELVEAASGAVACLSNVGPALGSLGPAGSFADVPTLGKVLLSLLMVLGRLEFYAIVVLLVPRFWRS
jgi:trk system potassium uptake protein TrkH